MSLHSNTGKKWPSELTIYQDPVSGATVRQLTHYKGHSSHFYFTYPCWYDNGRKIVFFSDRENRTNLFGVDLTSGDITQLTDLDPATRRHRRPEQEPGARRNLFLSWRHADGA